MKKFVLQEVLSSDQKKAFIDLPKKLYSGNKIWVCPLDSDIENVFSPLKNEKFNNGEAIRWIALDEKGEVIYVGKAKNLKKRVKKAGNSLTSKYILYISRAISTIR